uniref:Major facilitator superfamily (MFS) profile domain-containing protein n=1 Tax=Zooxanthella nutricula TaxID=1333877 RepID=A0A6U6QXD2_9DINO|mmetsp:Transcript_68864/g.211176  ORF Transcript_68864/g.211176 Transcript_68864/m.211176 type:complete len:428 (+) Transcript_68864:69-1352(+)
MSLFQAEASGSRVMFTVAMIMCLVTADRQIFNACIDPVRRSLGVGLEQMGILVSAYLWGYVALNLPGGALADRVGGLNVLICATVVWSAALALTPMATSTSIPFAATFACRLAFGAASGVSLPASASVVGKSLPAEERSRRISIVFAVHNGGPAIGLASASLLGIIDWPVLFYAFGAFGVCLAGGSLVRSCPSASSPKSSTQRFTPLLRAEDIPDTRASFMDDGQLLVERVHFAQQLMCLIMVHSIINITYALTQYWLPVYFSNDLHMSLAGSAGMAALPFVTMACCAFMSGPAGDRLVARGWNKLAVRRFMMAISHFGPAVCLIALAHIWNPCLAVGVLMVMLGMHAFNAAGFHAHLQDVAASKAGTILGITNTIGNLCSSISTVIIGYIVEQTGNFKLVFYMCAGMYCLGFAVFLWGVRPEKLFG